jgi:DNA-binding transcriptional ArsR family regulator
VSEATIVESRGTRRISRTAYVADDPAKVAAATHPTAWRILVELAKSPDYPSALAKRLRMHEQKVYYHINRLRKAGLLRVVREEQGQGAPAKILAPSAEAFALILPGGGTAFADATPMTVPMNAFLTDFAKDGTLDSRIVLGAPTPHGPFLTASRDSPYATQLGLFLGRYFATRRGMAVKLDTQVKAEGLERGNLIVVGGPVANIVSLDLNPRLAVTFDWSQVWRLRSTRTGKVYGDDTVGLVAKVANPWTAGAWVLLLAGLHYPGTIASLLAVTDFADVLLKNYEGGELYRVVQGLDRDGDGQIDDVLVLE